MSAPFQPPNLISAQTLIPSPNTAIGTAAGDGLASLIDQQGKTDVSGFYRAARLYNSGSISDASNLNVGVGTACYATDVANRLTGWVNAASKCTLSA